MNLTLSSTPRRPGIDYPRAHRLVRDVEQRRTLARAQHDSRKGYQERHAFIVAELRGSRELGYLLDKHEPGYDYRYPLAAARTLTAEQLRSVGINPALIGEAAELEVALADIAADIAATERELAPRAQLAARIERYLAGDTHA